MRVIPVLFEDHTLANFRPLAWSQPAYEIRTGLFSLRERMGHAISSDPFPGILLGRKFLAGLQQAAGWINDPGDAARSMKEAADSAEDLVYLWINGRVGWGHAFLAEIQERAASGNPVRMEDDQGLLAFSCNGTASHQMLDSWSAWEEQAGAAKGWSNAGSDLPTWTGAENLEMSVTQAADALKWIWQIVPHTSDALAADLAFLRGGISFAREPFGIQPLAGDAPGVWTQPSSLASWEAETHQPRHGLVTVKCEENLFCGPEVDLWPGVVIDARKGPVILDRNVTVMPSSFLEGPLYIGPGSLVKAGSTIYGESSFGIVNRISGEIGESTFGDFTNKQHDGFMGHAVLGSWVNLGAMTTCSDLKNNYGNVRVDLGWGTLDSALRFVGLLMGDHAKTAIGTLFNTGTSVGFASNVFGAGMPPKFVGNFSWGGRDDSPLYAVDRALETAEVVMGRRGCRLTEAHRSLFNTLFG